MGQKVILFGSVAGLDGHRNWPGHPERPSRLTAVTDALSAPEVAELLLPLEGRPARRDELLRVHTAAFLDDLWQLERGGGGDIDPDTSVAPGSWDTAVAAAGLGLAAAERLESGTGTAAFLAVRPPGHHAWADRAKGFCLINSVAVTAAALAQHGQRVMVLDWDVHHGDGTQAIFWDDPSVLYASTHQWPAYPWSGRASETGGERAPGTNVNVPLPAGSTGDTALEAMDQVIGPAADAFGPDWLLISAGYDAHRADPMADLAWAAGDFAALARRSSEWVSPGRTIAFLEGGYDLEALGRSAVATVGALAGADLAGEPPTSGGDSQGAVALALRARRQALEGGTV